MPLRNSRLLTAESRLPNRTFTGHPSATIPAINNALRQGIRHGNGVDMHHPPSSARNVGVCTHTASTHGEQRIGQ
jgi:hypothetical protein